MNRTDILIFGAAIILLVSEVIMFFPEGRQIGESGIVLSLFLVFIEFLCQRREE